MCVDDDADGDVVGNHNHKTTITIGGKDNTATTSPFRVALTPTSPRRARSIDRSIDTSGVHGLFLLHGG